MTVKVGGVTVLDNSRNFTDATSSVQATDLTATQKLKIPSGTTALRPGSPSTGQLYFDTDEGSLIVYDGTDWV